MGERKGGQQVAVYVENIPKAMSWQGLWFAFATHGNVVGAFIANRLSHAGKKFGFVRFDNRTDALRAITRLNDFRLYGYILKVALAKIKGKRSVDSRNNEDGGEKPERFQRVVQGNQDFEVKEKEDFQKEKPVEENFSKPSKVQQVVDAASEWDRKERRKIVGFVDQEDLWKLKRCLVGEMATVCSVKSIVDRLQNWGLGDIKV
ncbi:hypothetical protein GQ457_07G014110 [Hibiscus cannabinus]